MSIKRINVFNIPYQDDAISIKYCDDKKDSFILNDKHKDYYVRSMVSSEEETENSIKRIINDAETREKNVYLIISIKDNISNELINNFGAIIFFNSRS